MSFGRRWKRARTNRTRHRWLALSRARRLEARRRANGDLVEARLAAANAADLAYMLGLPRPRPKPKMADMLEGLRAVAEDRERRGK